MNKSYLLSLLVMGSVAYAQEKTIKNNFDFSQYTHGLKSETEIDTRQSGEEIPTDKYVYAYDYTNQNEKKIKEFRHFKIYGDETSLRAFTTFEYSDNGKTLTTKEKTRDGNGVWGGTDSFIYKYNDEGNISEITEIAFNQEAQEYENKFSYTFFYNEQNQMNKIIHKEWDTNEWLDIQAHNYTYNADGNLEEHTVHSFDPDTGMEDKASQMRYYTYENGHPTGYVWKNIDLDSGQETYQLKVETTTDENGNVVEEVENEWDSTENAWIPYLRYIYTHDTSVNQPKVLTAKNNQNYTRFYETWYKNPNPVTEMRSFEYQRNDDSWIATKIYRREYAPIESLNTHKVEVKTPNIKIYPNPATQYFALDTTLEKLQIEIYDSTGKIVQTFHKKQNQYQISALPTGIYFIVVKAENQTHQFKLLKK